MSTKTSDSFLLNNTIENVTDEDCKKVAHLVDAAKAFARSTHQCVYIIDYYKKSIVYASEALAALCGEPVSKIQDFGYNIYIEHVSHNELEVLKELYKKGSDLFYTFPVSERMDYSIQYDFHITNGKKAYLIHHTMTPLKLTNDGKIWLTLCTISLPSINTSGKCLIKKEGDRTYYQYNFGSHKWEKKTSNVLSDTEREILALSAQGYVMADIANIMCKSIDTIKTCKRNLFAKLGVKNIAEALFYSINHKLL